MKKIIFILLVLGMQSFCGSVAFSQTHDIKVNPLILSFKAWNISYQYKSATKKWALQYNSILFDDGFFIDTEIKGMQFTLDYKRYFPNDKTYIAPFIRYQNVTFEDNEETLRHAHPGFGFIVGKEFHPFRAKGWIMDAYIGVNHISREYEIIEGNAPVLIDVPGTMYGTFLRIGVTTGVRF